MDNLYDGAFRTLLNDCKQLVILLIMKFLTKEYYKSREVTKVIGINTMII